MDEIVDKVGANHSKTNLLISTDNDGLLSEFGDDDALLSVATDAVEISSSSSNKNNKNIIVPMHNPRISDPSSLKASELREQKNDGAELIEPLLEDGTSSRVSSVKLDFDSIGLVGRDSQINSLRSCLDRICWDGDDGSTAENQHSSSSSSSSPKDYNAKSKQVVLLSGESGAGKTSISKSLEEYILETKVGGLFVEGKFDMYTSDEPYSGIIKAFAAIFSKTYESSADGGGGEQEIIQQKLSNVLHDDQARLLSHLIPEFTKFFLPDLKSADTSGNGFEHDDELENGIERLKYTFRLLIRVFCDHFLPLVLFLDDLQWADVSSLQMIDYLISDTDNENPLLIIGSYRSDEADENSLLFNKILALKDKSLMYNFQVTELYIPTFQSDDTLAMIMALIPSTNDKMARALAKLCVKRTLGNPHFVMEFLKMLYHEGLIEYMEEEKIWTWDIARIEDATMSTANVVVLLQDRMRRMTKQAQVFLRIAALLGSTFSRTTLELVWKTKGAIMSIGGKATLPQLMEMVEKDNFIEACGPNKFRWVHDKVQEAAFFLLGNANIYFQFDIGTSLYYTLKPDQLEQDLFTVVDLINIGNRNKRKEFARVNLRATEKAMGLGAFQSAFSYAAHGIGLLEGDDWLRDRQLKLQLYTKGAEVAVILGDVETAERYIEEVLKQDGFTTMEILPLKMVKVDIMCTIQLRSKEAIDYCLAVLKDLGYKVTASRRFTAIQAIYNVSKTVNKLKKLPKDFDKDLGVVTDRKQKGILAVIAKLNDAAYNGKEPMLAILSDCRTVELTLKYGVSQYAGASFATMGAATMLFHQDYEATQRFMELALTIQNINGRIGKSKTAHIANMFGFAWTNGYNAIGESLANGYITGMQVGETEHSMWDLLQHRVVLPFYLGRPLDQILTDCSKVLVKMQEVAQKTQEFALRCYYQTILNLADPSSAHMEKLEGKILDRSIHRSEEAAYLACIHIVEGDLLLFFSDFEVAAKRAVEKGELLEKLNPAMCIIMSETFHRAVALYAAARRTKQKRFKNGANKLRKRIIEWEKKGNPNCMHFVPLLDAEFAALNSKVRIAKAKYVEAIAIAKEHGFVQYEALFNERYADYLSEDLSLPDKAELHQKEAIRAYSEWGAHAKVAQLRMGGA
ncbi:unnamed protein product [Cylindrotheca closterium]|uniref:Orc1-like AAA ATPase domain-containing protein n=1 Tax=Cylindrotheca closterium TaxID=2856 RepID=A0AAD2CK40_9STRA|nr:unnamed protein product [Cylindrotheca closterium]